MNEKLSERGEKATLNYNDAHNNLSSKTPAFQGQDETLLALPQYSVFAGSDVDRRNSNHNNQTLMAGGDASYFVLDHEAVAQESNVLAT